jgi:hypothetical protein
MISITSTIEICCSPDVVFDYITSPANDLQWKYGTLASSSAKNESPRQGATFQTMGHFAGRRTQNTFQITNFEADHLYGFITLAGPLHLQTLYTLRPANGCTRVKVLTRARSDGDFGVALGALQRYMRQQLQDDLALLKAILEMAPLPAPAS